MFGTALRLLATGAAGRRVGGYVKNLRTRYLLLAIAGIIFSIAAGFGILAIFWKLILLNYDPVTSAAIMAGGLFLIGFLTVLIAYGTTEAASESVSQALTDPVAALRSEVPSAEEVGRHIEDAVRIYGPLRVTAGAAVAGLIAGLLSKRLGDMRAGGPPPRRYRRRPDRENYRYYD